MGGNVRCNRDVCDYVVISFLKSFEAWDVMMLKSTVWLMRLTKHARERAR